MTVFLFSLAGIPPLGGWFAKFQIFHALVSAETPSGVVLAVVVGVNSVIALFYYAVDRSADVGRRGARRRHHARSACRCRSRGALGDHRGRSRCSSGCSRRLVGHFTEVTLALGIGG